MTMPSFAAALNEQKAEIRIQFRDVSRNIFSQLSRNELVIRVGPTEAIYAKIMLKEPGLSNDPVISELDLSYSKRFQNLRIPDAYESLLLDVMGGDRANFVRSDELEAAWKIFTPVLQEIDKQKIRPSPYPYGSRGPEEAGAFVEKYGFKLATQAYNYPEHKL